MAENKISDIIHTSLEKIRELVDAQTIIGEPINTSGGTTIIPVSKVTMGFASGGIDYTPKPQEQKTPAVRGNFGGGGGTGVAVTPVAFLVVSSDGTVELLAVNAPAAADPIDKVSALLDRSPEILEKIKAIFTKKKDEKEAEETHDEFEESAE
jgi:sporulation protein YtfJ